MHVSTYDYAANVGEVESPWCTMRARIKRIDVKTGEGKRKKKKKKKGKTVNRERARKRCDFALFCIQHRGSKREKTAGQKFQIPRFYREAAEGGSTVEERG